MIEKKGKWLIIDQHSISIDDISYLKFEDDWITFIVEGQFVVIFCSEEEFKDIHKYVVGDLIRE